MVYELEIMSLLWILSLSFIAGMIFLSLISSKKKDFSGTFYLAQNKTDFLFKVVEKPRDVLDSNTLLIAKGKLLSPLEQEQVIAQMLALRNQDHKNYDD